MNIMKYDRDSKHLLEHNVIMAILFGATAVIFQFHRNLFLWELLVLLFDHCAKRIIRFINYLII